MEALDTTTAPPKLFVQLIGTAGISDDTIIDFMLTTFSAEELSEWAVLDVHHYYAWSGEVMGCYSGDCAYACDADMDPASLTNASAIIKKEGLEWAESFTTNGTIPMIACSEFSLATFYNSNNACRGSDILQLMYDSQMAGMGSQGLFASFFWTWRMPFGGTHEYGWSLKHFLTGQH